VITKKAGEERQPFLGYSVGQNYLRAARSTLRPAACVPSTVPATSLPTPRIVLPQELRETRAINTAAMDAKKRVDMRETPLVFAQIAQT
jgi:hypothetical protein